MTNRTKDSIQLLASLVAIPIGANWLLARIVPGDSVPLVPLPISVILLLGGLGGAFFAIYRLADADRKGAWKLAAAGIPLSVLVIYAVIWLSLYRSDYDRRLDEIPVSRPAPPEADTLRPPPPPSALAPEFQEPLPSEQ